MQANGRAATLSFEVGRLQVTLPIVSLYHCVTVRVCVVWDRFSFGTKTPELVGIARTVAKVLDHRTESLARPVERATRITLATSGLNDDGRLDRLACSGQKFEKPACTLTGQGRL